MEGFANDEELFKGFNAIDNKEQIELEVIQDALNLANTAPPVDGNKEEWANQLCGNLNTGPKGTTFKIDRSGSIKIDVLGKNIVKSVRKSQRQMAEILDNCTRKKDAKILTKSRIIRDTESKDKIKKFKFDIPAQVWVHSHINHTFIEPNFRRVFTPTLQDFVGYAASIAHKPKWRKLIGKCSECQSFFLNPKRRGGRRRETCGLKCQRIRNNARRRHLNISRGFSEFDEI